MKIKDNRNHNAMWKSLYQIGNVIRDMNDNLYMVVSDNDCKYALLDLETNEVSSPYEESLHALYEYCYGTGDALADVSLIVTGKE